MNVTMRIKVLSAEERSGWRKLEDAQKHFTNSEILEMVQRYQDAQQHAINYRHRSQLKNKLMKERLAELEALHAAQQNEKDEGEA